jgi:hypothetical protein|tara:strand:+ start:322 stop:477 length:156 start_codon:yes stop_codon:yes gene_type:complete
MNKYIAHVTISVPVEAKDSYAAYDFAHDEVLMKYIKTVTSIYIENIEIKDA